MLRTILRRSNAVRQVNGVAPLMHDWVKDPSVDLLPHVASLTSGDISRVFSTVSSHNIGKLSPDFISTALRGLSERLSSPLRVQGDVIAALHVLDRLAAQCTIHEGVDELAETLCSIGSLKVSKTDAFLGSRAALLLGYPALASRLVASTDIGNMSLSSIVQLSLLSLNTTEKGLVSSLHREVVSRLEKSEQLHQVTSSELSSALKSVSLFSVSGLSTVPAAHTTRMMKKAGTELVRRIELRTISTHSLVDLIEIYSGQPPCPIHPLFLQAAYAYLLETNNFKTLSSDEISRILHASTLAEIENTILTKCLVSHFTSNSQELLSVNPRTYLRILSGVSLSRTYLAAPLVRSLTCVGSLSSLKSHDDLTTLTTALANLIGAGLCQSTIRWVLQALDPAKVDLVTASNLLLLSSHLSPIVEACEVVSCVSESAIPPSALEITEKANPAMPRSDVKKKRLAKRSEVRASNLGTEEGQISTKICEECTCIESSKVVVTEISNRLRNRCVSLLKGGPDPSLEWKEVERSVSDILNSIFLVEDFNTLTTDQLGVLNDLVDECIHVLAESEVPTLPFDAEIADIESSVVRTMKNLCLGSVQTPVVTVSNLRISGRLFIT